MKKVSVIGAGFSGLSAACYLGKQGFDVTVYEKNNTIGGRAAVLERDGFKFDLGPTFYWMPDIFESFFNDFNKQSSDFYQLIRLDPGYEIYFGTNDSLKISADINKLYQTYESLEPGSSKFLKRYLKDGEFNYRVAIDKVIEKPGRSIFELIMPETIARSPQFLKSISHEVRSNLKNEKLRQALEFPVLFLGAKASDTPLFYCFMNYADIMLGTWHIKGGMFMLAKAMESIAKSYGAKIITNAPVTAIDTKNGCASGLTFKIAGETIKTQSDFIISSADYHHTELLLDPVHRNYRQKYWSKKVFAPSAMLFYVAFNKRIKNISHHTLFFDAGFREHAETIYDVPRWPLKPLFYASFPSVSDSSFAPEGCECGIFLIPVAAGLKETDELRESYFLQIIDRMEKITGQEITNNILFKESFSVIDFVKNYHAYKGNAYGLANILTQTAFLKPKMQNRHLPNLLYTGQLTVPGPGVPPAIISGKIAAKTATEKMRYGSTI